MENAKYLNIDTKLDRLGIAVSCVCAVHCAAMPFLIALLPLLGASFLSDEKTEIFLFGLAFVIGILNLIPSYFRHHRKFAPLAVFLIGFLLILAGRFVFEENFGLEVFFSALGGVFFAAAHFINYRLCRKCCALPEK